MKPFFYRQSKFKSRSKTKKRQQRKLDWIAVGLLFVGVFSFYCVLFPESAGLWGRRIARFLGWFSGVGRYIIPILISYVSLRALFKRENPVSLLQISLGSGLFWSFTILMAMIGDAVWSQNFGGVIGKGGSIFFNRLFGYVGSWIVVFGLIGTLSLLLSGISPREAAHRLWDMLVEDWQSWRKAKPVVKTKNGKSPVVPAAEALTQPLQPAPPPKIMGLTPEKQKESVQKEASKEESKNGLEPKIKVPEKPKKVASKPASEKPVSTEKVTDKAEPPAPAPVPYQSPSLEIFKSAEGKNPVPKEELTNRANLLEQTLANFGIAARVVEIHPGPVITRYDLKPAAGVKVASIVSRSDDLALAMRSTGIRVIAPIPGKGAVGIELPNSNPEMVGLQEMLGKQEFTSHKSPLAFALGKTVSGEPYFVDLAAMPHMLIAGATGAGKSVVIHSLLSSILYRMPPNKVKFVLIDPKRLELPSYTLIPHLYDPCHSPMQAEVITNAKQASKALTRMVKVMEFRYDLFAKANVRNIDSFNQKKKAAGEPETPYIVVVIDELADLMLTLPKEVEDSVQRLAQMARAVGIHLVLATQRPSVDVITGVIKANLPARIALRVASGTDSRVIVDTVGAECLLGKGDMLFLPPASMDPIRVQGAFVSEKEVEHLVDHVKQYGLPQYDDLFGSGSALEFAVEDKKEMKDMIEALKLILERHRVSQDLLKAHLGSSARATNVLSLLEVKEFIRKPEGSNRWEINFDMIEEFLGKIGNIPEAEMV